MCILKPLANQILSDTELTNWERVFADVLINQSDNVPLTVGCIINGISVKNWCMV